MKLEDLKIKKNGPICIKRKLGWNIIKQIYENSLNKGYAHPAQIFKSADKWYEIHTYNNPYNFGSPNAELKLIIENKSELQRLMNDKTMVFWGIGKSDTEMEIVNIKLEIAEKPIYIIGIDINKRFLKDFGNSLKCKLLEEKKLDIYYLGINDLFENIERKDLEIGNKKLKIHICLGNTIGNYNETDEIIEIIDSKLIIGDKLVISFQMKKYLEKIIERYKNNKYFESMIITGIQNERNHLENEDIIWIYNKDKGQVEAWINDIQVFRSKKFDPRELASKFIDNGFTLIKEIKDKWTTCMQFYEKK